MARRPFASQDVVVPFKGTIGTGSAELTTRYIGVLICPTQCSVPTRGEP